MTGDPLNDFIDKMLAAEADQPATQEWQQGVYAYAKPHIGEGAAMELAMALHYAAVTHANGGPRYVYGVTRGTMLRLARLDLNARARRRAAREALDHDGN